MAIIEAILDGNWDVKALAARRDPRIRASRKRADNLLVLKALAVRAGLRPAKLPDIRASQATNSLHKIRAAFSPLPPAVAEQSTLPPSRLEAGE